MIFRNTNGQMVIINRNDFKNDKLFYKKIMEIKTQTPFTKLNQNKKIDTKINFSNYIIRSNL